MKNLVIATCCTLISVSLCAQTGKTPAKPVTKPATKPAVKVAATPVPQLKTLNDSASYAIGLSIAAFCKQQNIKKLNNGLIAKSINDVSANKAFLLPTNVCDNIIGKLFSGQKIAAVTPTPNSKAPIKTPLDSASYAIGLNRAMFFKEQGVETLAATLVTKGIDDGLSSKPVFFDDRTANFVLNKVIFKAKEDKIKPTVDAGRAFLENNKKRAEVKTTASGLQYEVVKEGMGIKPTSADTFVCNYKGTLIDGTEFDNSYKRNQPLVYPVGAVIRGWTEGLQLMPVGSKYNFYIPYELGYGPFGSPPAIPGGAVLIFEVELLDVKQFKALDQVKPGN